MLDETKKEKVPFFVFVCFVFESSSSSSSTCFSPLAAAKQPVRDGEDEGGAREEKVLLGARGAERKGEGEGFRDIKKRENNTFMYNCEYNLAVILKA